MTLPALRQADVGVAMGIRGTDVAKEAAAIVLQDDRFETIAVAVEEGRVIFDNIRKFVFYLFSCNLAEILVLLVAGLLALPLPLLPLQILWLNLVTDTFPALALAMEPGDADVMQRPPRNPQEAILSRAFLTSVFVYGALIAAVTLVAFAWALRYAPGHATTVAFLTLALTQVFHLGNARSSGAVLRPARGPGQQVCAWRRDAVCSPATGVRLHCPAGRNAPSRAAEPARVDGRYGLLGLPGDRRPAIQERPLNRDGFGAAKWPAAKPRPHRFGFGISTQNHPRISPSTKPVARSFG